MKIIISERQKNLLTETIPAAIRRRLDSEYIHEIAENIIEYDIDPCEWEDTNDFVVDFADLIVQNIIIDANDDGEATSKEKDLLWNYVIDNFGGYIRKLYISECQ
jgi:hypothetical protein